MSERACKIRGETAHGLRERSTVRKPSLKQMSVTLENSSRWHWQWSVRRQALVLPMITGHSNIVWQDHCSSKECGSQALPHHLFWVALYTAVDICPVSILNMVHIFVLLQHDPVFTEDPYSQSHQPANSKGSVLACTACWKTQFRTGAWGKGHFYSIIPSITSPFLFPSRVQSLCNVHAIYSWTNSFMSLHCRNFNFLPFRKVGSKTLTKWFLELKLLSLDVIHLVKNSTPRWNII